MSAISDPGISCVAITKSDSTVYNPPFRAIYVGGGGIVKVRSANGDDNVEWTVPAGGYILCRCDKIYSATTTATLLIGLR
jgi:hypothetical protein